MQLWMEKESERIGGGTMEWDFEDLSDFYNPDYPIDGGRRKNDDYGNKPTNPDEWSKEDLEGEW